MEPQVLTLKEVTIVHLDLEGKENYYAGAKRFGLRRFTVMDKVGRKTNIRIEGHRKDEPEKQERDIAEVERFGLGDLVDVDVLPWDWKINDLSGTSYFYRAIRGV